MKKFLEKKFWEGIFFQTQNARGGKDLRHFLEF